MAHKIVGQRESRYDGLDHITGRTQFVDDVVVPGTLTVKTLRSPIHKGTVLHIDTQAAERSSGVEAVVCAQDVPNNVYGFGPFADEPVLAQSIRYKGEPICGVAAHDEDAACAALEKIKVEYEEHTPVFDPKQALQPDSPQVRPQGNVFMFGDKPYFEVQDGDVERGFSEADQIIESEYTQHSVEHAALETQCSLAVPRAGGNLTVYTVSQAPWVHINELAHVLNLAPGKLRYLGGTVGGGFGGKGDLHADPLAALLALKTGKPVKWCWTREEELLYSTHRGVWIVSFKDGVKKDGRIVARQVRVLREAGAYTAFNHGSLMTHCNMVTGPYRIPHTQVRGQLVYTNKATAMAMRGFGVNGAACTVEMQMSKIAKILRISPFEIRFTNALRNGDRMPVGQVMQDTSLIEVMKKTAERAGVELSVHNEDRIP